MQQDGAITYRIALIEAGSDHVFAECNGADYRLPNVTIPRGARPAHEIQKAIRQRWNVTSAVLDFCFPVCVAELFGTTRGRNDLNRIPLSQLPSSELTDQDREIVRAIAAGEVGGRGPFSRAGWINEAAQWIQDTTGLVVLPAGIEQYNANGNFALVRFRSDAGPTFWLKATGAPNRHEFQLTAVLAEFCPEYLPQVVAMRQDWNAWLMADAGEPLGEGCAPELMTALARLVADMQKRSIPHVGELLEAGTSDQRIHLLQRNIEGTIAYLEEAMAAQTSTKVAPIGRLRLHEIGILFEDACAVIAELGIPDTIFHNDLNRTNIVVRDGSCFLIDWAEAGVGIPFVSLEQLLLLVEDDYTGVLQWQIREAYKRKWLASIQESKIDRAFALMPLIAPYSHLYGRGDLFQHRYDPRVQSYARTLARYMDRAAKSPMVMDILSGCEAS